MSGEILKSLTPHGYVNPRQLAWLKDRFPAYAQEITTRLAVVPGLLDERTVRVVFGGHFSCGKSSMLNMLIQRDLLPTGDLPETGVACELRSGRADRALVVVGDTQREIPVETKAIAAQVSLIGDDGEVRAEVRQTDRIHITLRRTPIPASTVWVDSPGINDPSAIDATSTRQRAEALADSADVLVWVVNSKQLVSEVEQRFLREYAERRHADRIVYLINSFLGEDSPQGWAYFVGKVTPAARQRIHGLHLAEAWQPEIVHASAQAAMKRPKAYGRQEAIRLVTGISDPDHPRVRLARLQRGAAEIAGLEQQAAAWVAQAEQALAREQEAVAARNARLAERRVEFERAVRAAVAETFRQHTPAAEACGGEVANEISAGYLQRDHTYANSLHAKIGLVAADLANSVLWTIAHVAEAHEQTGPSPHACSAIRNALAAPWVEIPVPANASRPSRPGVGAVVGGILGTLLAPGIGTAIGAAIGGGVGGAVGADEALNNDAAGAKANAITAGRTVAGILLGNGAEVQRLAVNACTPNRPPEPTPPRTDIDQLRQLQGHFAWVRSVFDKAAAATAARVPRPPEEPLIVTGGAAGANPSAAPRTDH